MKSWPQKMSAKSYEVNIYYLVKDILSCFPNNFEENFINSFNHHYIVKEAIRQIFFNEVKEKKPNFKTLAGSLILINSFLRQMKRVAIYEVIESLEAISYCFHKSIYKTIKKLSAQTVIRLFITLYFEYIFMPSRKLEGKEFINKFKKYFSLRDIINAMNIYVFPNFIFEYEFGIKLGYGQEANTKLKKILKQFYSKNN